jgi:hypothetical protein
MFLPDLPILPDISLKRLLAPWTHARIRNRRKRAHALVLPGVLQEQRERTMAAHGMSGDGDARGIKLGEGGEECVGKLAADVGFHFVVFGPGALRCVDVEACAGAEVVGVVFALYF